jgi:hypothetical protein
MMSHSLRSILLPVSKTQKLEAQTLFSGKMHMCGSDFIAIVIYCSRKTIQQIRI